MNLIFFGPPGAGKGTQSALLVERDGMNHISTGDIFRKNMTEQTELGMQAKSYVDKGELVPDSVVISMVVDVLGGLEGKSFILDGFPRTVPQAEALEKLLTNMNLKVDKAVFFEVKNDILLNRLTGRRVCSGCGATYHIEFKPTEKDGVCDKCGAEVIQRKDDHKDVISTRLEAYENSTAPLKLYYQQTGQFVNIDALGETEEVYGRIRNIIS